MERILGSDLLGLPSLGVVFLEFLLVFMLLGGIEDTLLNGTVRIEVVKVGGDFASRRSPPLAGSSGVTGKLRERSDWYA